MVGALFDIHCRLNNWEFKSEPQEEVMFIDDIPFL